MNTLSKWLHYPIQVGDIHRLWSSKRPRVAWYEYVLAALLAYLLPLLSLGIEWVFTFQHQVFLASRFGPPIFWGTEVWLWLIGPATVTLLVFLPLLRYPVRCRLAAIVIGVAWIIFWLSGEVGVK